MNTIIVIQSVGIYHPENVVDNDYFIQYYSKLDARQGERVTHLLEHLGKKKRYLADFPKENVLTMAASASYDALERGGYQPNEIDGIIFSTDTPEYTSPSNAIMLRATLGANNAQVAYDLNANCVGMVVAVDQARALMQSNPRINRLLVVGSSMIQHYGLDTNPITYACIGDAAAAVILEKITTDSTVGFRDALYETNDDLKDHILMPGCGSSNLYSKDLPKEAKNWTWEAFDTEEAEQRCARMILRLLADHQMNLEQVQMIFMTQFSLNTIKEVASHLNTTREKIMYIGDVYAYTGTSSPFIAYYHALEEDRIKAGDHLVFWSAGSGLTTTGLLYTAR